MNAIRGFAQAPAAKKLSILGQFSRVCAAGILQSVSGTFTAGVSGSFATIVSFFNSLPGLFIGWANPILNARCRLLTIRSCHPWCCFRVRASLWLSWPASAITVLILGNNALNPLSSRAPARRSEVSAGSTRLATSRPSVSTKMWRLRPFTRLCASKPRPPARSVVLTDWPSMITTDGQAARPHHDGPARRGRDVDGPTRGSFARLESNGRPCHTVENRVATFATGSLSVGGKR